MGNKKFFLVVCAAASVLLLSSLAYAEPVAPAVTINTTSSSGIEKGEVYAGLKLLLLVSSLVLVPTMLMTMTCFTRIAVVLSLTRQAIGTAQTPPNTIVLGMSLFLTFAVMGPVFEKVYNDALLPYTQDTIDHTEALSTAWNPMRDFMLRHTREQDLALFIDIQRLETPESPETLSPLVVVPAFVISELNTAFQIAFLIFLPFLILDMIISSVLTSMSMITLPPTVISLPIKLMLFVLIDGWHLIVGNLVQSYHV